jgi:hypothetical protein
MKPLVAPFAPVKPKKSFPMTPTKGGLIVDPVCPQAPRKNRALKAINMSKFRYMSSQY